MRLPPHHRPTNADKQGVRCDAARRGAFSVRQQTPQERWTFVHVSRTARRGWTALTLSFALVLGPAAVGTASAAPVPTAAQAPALTGLAAVKAKTKVRIPERIRWVKAKPGAKPGTVTFTWKQNKKHTTAFVLEIASTSFSPTNKSLPKRGRDYQRIVISGKKSSYTLSAKRAAKSGATSRSGAHLYYRFSAINKTKAGKRTRVYPGLRAVLPRPAKPSATGTSLRVASYNVASVKATLKKPGRSWDARRAKVASTILSSRADVVGLQELGPGSKYDGGSTKNAPRQTNDLVATLRSQAKAKGSSADYRLVRTTPYVAPGTSHGSQGARILYDASRYTLRSTCAETTGSRNYSDSCTIAMPVLSGDSRGKYRKAAYARFEDRRTGKTFYVVSAHLDPRKDSKGSKGRYDKLRRNQVRTIMRSIDAINTTGDPVILAGDLNSRQSNQFTGSLPHRALIAAGYHDGAASAKRINAQYPTTTGWATRAKAASIGYGPRLDYVLAKGIQGSVAYKAHVKKKDSRRASDHHLVWAQFRLP